MKRVNGSSNNKEISHTYTFGNVSVTLSYPNGMQFLIANKKEFSSFPDVYIDTPGSFGNYNDVFINCSKIFFSLNESSAYIKVSSSNLTFSDTHDYNTTKLYVKIPLDDCSVPSSIKDPLGNRYTYVKYIDYLFSLDANTNTVTLQIDPDCANTDFTENHLINILQGGLAINVK